MPKGEDIQPPRTGDWDLTQLLNYPNARVRSLTKFLQREFGYFIIDSFTGEYISLLCEYVDPTPNGGYDFSRLQRGIGQTDNYLAWLRFNNHEGPPPWRILYVESRVHAVANAPHNRMRVDGSYLFGMDYQGPGTLNDRRRRHSW